MFDLMTAESKVRDGPFDSGGGGGGYRILQKIILPSQASEK